MDPLTRCAGASVTVVLLVLLLAPPALAQTTTGAVLVVRVPNLNVTSLTDETPALREGERGSMSFRVENVGDYPARFFLRATELPPLLQPPSLGMLVEPSSAELQAGKALIVTVHLYAFSGNASFSNVQLDLVGEGGMIVAGSASRVELAAAPVTLPPPAGGGLSRDGMTFALVALAGAATWGVWRFARRDAWRFLGALAVAPLYTRLAPSTLLDQEKRDVLYKLILAEPGVNYTALKERTGLPVGVLVHHLRTLERHRLVTSRRDGAFRRFAPVHGAFPEAAPAPITPMQTRVLGLLGGAPMTQRQLAEALGLSQQGANRHVKALERRGLLAIRYEAGEWRCHAVASGAMRVGE